MYHLMGLVDEACPNHAYPIRHKFKDRAMMRSFVISGSLTWGTELDELPNGSDMTRFPKENAIMKTSHPHGLPM
jgi:hypothetical protein